MTTLDLVITPVSVMAFALLTVAIANWFIRLLLMPGSHDEYGDIDRHIETVIAFLNRVVGMKDAFNQPNGQPETGRAK